MNISHQDNLEVSEVERDVFEEGQSQILYDIVTYKEWEQDPEVVKPVDGLYRLPSARGWFGGVSGVVGSGILPAQVERLVSAQLAWSIAVTADASLIAVLQEACLEIWSSKDNYGHLVGRCGVTRDPAPQWRQLVWTQDNSMLVMAHSSGQVEVLDTLGSNIYNVISPGLPASQPSWSDSLHRTGPTLHTYATVFFTNMRVRDKVKWTAELVLVELSGRIISFLVSPSGYQEMTSYSVGWSLTSATWCPGPDLLVTAGGPTSPLAGKRRLVGRASHAGIVALRLLNDSPHYVTLLDGEEVAVMSASSWSLFSSQPQTDYISTMAVSGCGGKLAAVHQSGTLSIWRLPSLTLESSTLLAEQPSFNELNPQLLQSPERRRAKAEFLSSDFRYNPVNVAWWNKEAVIVARMSGALSVIGTVDLSNLLGDSPEFFEGVPKISQCFEKGFFGLECESVTRGRRPSSFSDSAGEDPDVDLEESDGEDVEGVSGWMSYGKRGATALAFYVTDSERFAPPKKKAKIMRRTYRLLALVSTSPEELYSRKIAAEEYGEAIMLAQHYGLDTDPVYERQWRMSTKSTAAIHDYLAKMKRRSTVLKECLETIPEDIDSARQLLLYGLRGTDLEAMLALSSEGDQVDFVLCDQQRVLEEFDTMEEKEEAERAARQRLVARISWEKLSLVQKDLVKTRHTLLYYLDCLDTLEDVLGGGQRAADRFCPATYSRLRSQAPLENCLMAARSGDQATLLSLLSCSHSSITLPHWLPIISCFPETVRPADYSDLLPVISLDGGVVPFFKQPARELDWSEQPLAVKWTGHKMEHNTDILYKEGREADKQFSTGTLTSTMVGRWYECHARNIAKVSSLPDVALELLQAGLERGVDVSWRLLHNLRTLDCLVYEVQPGQGQDMELETLEQMESLDQMGLLLMGKEGKSILAVRKFLVPFLQRLEDNIPGEMGRLLGEFCTSQAETDLTFPLVVVEHSGPDKTGPVLYSVVDTVRLAVDCCYASTSGAQVDLMEKLFISVVGYLRENPATRQPRYNIPRQLKAEVDQLKIHLDVSRTLIKNGVVRPLSLMRDMGHDVTAMRKLFDAVMARAEGAKPALDQDGWRQVFRDLQLLQNLLPVVNMEGVVYSYCESLLSSGSPTNISLAGSVLEGMMSAEQQVSLVVTAWRHYYSVSGDLGDHNLDLARQVLALVRDTAPHVREVAECHDLIAALQSMADFGLGSVLPVTILECKDRLQFVRLAVQARQTAYKNSQRLMKLASLLKVAPDQLEGEVWAIIAGRALEVKDYLSCHAACNNFIRVGFTRGWDICYALAARAEFSDIDKCIELLAFAVSHCDGENIENILQTLSTMEQKNLARNINSKIDTELHIQESQEDDEEIFEDTMEDLDGRVSREASPLSSDLATQLLNIPSLSKQFLVENKVSAKVWQQTASWLNQVNINNMSRSFHEDEIINKEFEVVRVPAFYLSLYPGDQSDLVTDGSLDLTYTKFSKPSQPSTDISLASYQLLRLACLTHTLVCLSPDQQEVPGPPILTPDLLQQLLPLVASQDLQLGLLLLLSITDPSQAETVLETLPRTFPALCLVITYYSVLVVADHLRRKGQSITKVFSCSPLHLVETALSLREREGIKSELIDSYYSHMSEYLELATDYHQGNLLSSLSGDVDVTRFTADSQYKEDTILGLAMFPAQDKWDFTLTLARRYKIDMWVVAATHLEAVMVDSAIPSEEAKQQIEERGLGELLTSRDPDLLIEWMSTKVLPLLSGEDIPRMLLYYSVLHQVAGQRFAKHVTVLEKIKTSRVSLDFRLVESRSVELLDMLDDKNVHLIAEIVDDMKEIPGTITSSSVFGSWAFKVFIRHGESTDNWIEAFSVCQKFMEKMSSGDFKMFAKRCILSAKSIESVPRPARGRIFKKAVKFVEIKIAGRVAGDWVEVEVWLQMIKNHSEKFKKPLSIDIISKVDEKYASCFDEFEMTGGDQKEIVKVIADLVLREVQKSVITSVIQVWKQHIDQVESGLMEVLTAVVKQVEGGDTVIKQPFLLISRITSMFNLPGEALSLLLGPLTTMDSVPVGDRLVLVNMLKELGSTSDSPEAEMDNNRLAELYRTQHEVQKLLLETNVEQSDLINLETKHNLFCRLLEGTKTADQALKVYSLVSEWEGLEDNYMNNVTDNCLLRVALRLLELDPAGYTLLDLLEGITETKMPTEVAESLLEQMDKGRDEKQLGMKVVLKLSMENRYKDVLQVLETQTTCDLTLASLLVEQSLACRLVTSPLYPVLVRLVTLHEGDLLDKLSRQLREAGYRPQASSLQMISEGVPAALRTMASVAQRYLNR